MPEGTGGARHEGSRRALNILVAVVALFVTLPVWVLIAIAIKLTSPGPIFYKQLRVGLDRRCPHGGAKGRRRRNDLGGRPFEMYKFRTMVADAERATGPVWSGKGDSRITPLGRFMRQCRLDELPQLWNVLKGDMNVVGPRPERPAFFGELRDQIPGYARRQRARPGITGYAQVTFEADGSIDDVARKVRYDLEYIERAGFWTDLRIMGKTVPVLLFRDQVLKPASRSGGPSITPVPFSARPSGARGYEAGTQGGLPDFAAATAFEPERPRGIAHRA